MKRNYSLWTFILVFSLMGSSLPAQIHMEGFATITGRLILGIDSTDNIFLGTNTGANTTGTRNMFLGNEAGFLNEDGINNVFVGNLSGTGNISGGANTFMGYVAGNGNTTGSDNTYIGAFAGSVNTGFQNAYLGSTAGLATTTGFQNTFLGTTAGQTNTSGSRNTYVGFAAGKSLAPDLDSLDRAIAIGYKARVNCDNCAVIGGIGVDAVKVGIGTDEPAVSLDVNGAATITGRLILGIDSTDNIFVGTNTGQATTGTRNVFIGNEAGFLNEDGINNVFLGNLVGTSNISGGANTFMGYAAGNGNTTGSDNTYIGASAGIVNAGFQNAYLGSTAGLATTTGFQNTFLGTTAGQTNTSGSRNTYVGFAAGKSLAPNQDSLDRAIAIGYKARVNCDNCAVIGGTGIDAVKLGIATDEPSATLDVNGMARIRNLPTGTGMNVVADSLGNLMLDVGIVLPASARSIEILQSNLDDKDAQLEALEIRLLEKDRQVEALEHRLNKLELMLAIITSKNGIKNQNF